MKNIGKLLGILAIGCLFPLTLVQAQEIHPGYLVERESLETSALGDFEIEGYSSGNVRVTLKGLDAPVAEVIGLMFARGDRVANGLNESDRLIYFATKTSVNRRRFALAEIEDICRYILTQGNSGYSLENAAYIGDRLTDVQQSENGYILGHYNDMLNALSTEGSQYIEDRVYELRLKAVSNVADFVKESEVDPDGFIDRRYKDCQNI